MKNRIAVFANGWNNLAIEQALNGIRSATDKLNIDIFLFLSFAAFNQSELRRIGEDNIFELPDYSDFDGAILFSTMFNFNETPHRIAKKLVNENIPGVSVGLPMEGLSLIGIDNFKGMYALVDHLVKEHHVKNPAFIAGTRDHSDSNERLQATKEALLKNGIKLNPEYVRYADWEYGRAMNAALEFCQKENPPDCYICANDNMAIAVCVGLSRMGFSVPKDIVVTGFDKTSFAESFYPSITTVYQDYEKLGYNAALQLLKKIEGTAESEKVIVPSEFVLNESCGCKDEHEAESARHQFCINAYTKDVEWTAFQRQEVDMNSAIFACTSFAELKENILKFFTSHKPINLGKFYFILDSKATKTLINSSFPVPKKFSNKMDCIVAVKNNIAEYKGEFNRKKMIPDYKKGNSPEVYTFTSLHFDDMIFGYIVQNNAIPLIKDMRMNHFMTQINFNIEQFRKNCKLEEMNKALRTISSTDQLTGLNNRFGMEYNGVRLMEEAHKEKKPCAVVFTDINRMKHINDNFGHLQGDLAIRTVSSVILTELPEGWIGIRYGGDEFIALGACDDKKVADDFIRKIKEGLEKQVAAMHLSYPLTISCGFILTDPASSSSLVDYINKADEVMYHQKKKTYI